MDDRRLEIIIGNLLRTGVLTAAVLVFAGGVAYLAAHRGDHIGFHTFTPGDSSLRTVQGIAASAARLNSEGLMQLGLLLLIATPVARVIMAVFGFALERDWLYFVVSLIVLAVLLASLTRAA
ncbi:MAG TPA: DUF1634 domain-containing protein [Terracidiphilus sp.]|nr:DUF1634 domain-containing protein [Terracidiphilus sp.]